MGRKNRDRALSSVNGHRIRWFFSQMMIRWMLTASFSGQLH